MSPSLAFLAVSKKNGHFLKLYVTFFFKRYEKKGFNSVFGALANAFLDKLKIARPQIEKKMCGAIFRFSSHLIEYQKVDEKRFYSFEIRKLHKT